MESAICVGAIAPSQKMSLNPKNSSCVIETLRLGSAPLDHDTGSHPNRR